MEFGKPSRRSTSEFPKPDTGLAEWTSKIRALQRQVDADEEAEQKRLEEEIAASRLARQRRSRGLGYASRADSLDLTKGKGYAIEKEEVDSPHKRAEPIDRQEHAQETLLKLTSCASQSPRKSSPVASPPIQHRSPSLPAYTKKGEMSLAAFMGGRADGPRLNKHAPQQDAYDSTQFEQRTHTGAPHPVFGRGGIAMPGMTTNGWASTSTIPGAVEHSNKVGKSRPQTPEKERDSHSMTPTVTKRYPDLNQQSVVTSQETGRRDRTMSTPTEPSSNRSSIHSDPRDGYRTPETLRRPVSQSSMSTVPTKTYDVRPMTPEMRSKSPGKPPNRPQGRHLPTNGTEIPSLSSTSTLSSPFTPRPMNATPPSSRTSPITTPSLARPIRPEPRFSPQEPHIPSFHTASPAFLRPPAQKDPTPSLSRLQGRGFVQNMVKVSSQITAGIGGSSPSSDKARPTSPRRSSVLDRWPVASSTTNTASPPVSPKQPPNLTARTASLSPPSPAARTTHFPKTSTSEVDSSKSLIAASSLPSILPTDENLFSSNRQPLKKKSIPNIMPPEGSPGLGSSSTLISYVKTTKTVGDATPFPPPTLSADVDELGIRKAAHERTARKPATASELAAPSGKPLSHPTRDRVRKPRKARDGLQTQVQGGSVFTSQSATSTTVGATPSAKSPWSDQSLIGVKPVLSGRTSVVEESRFSHYGSSGLVDRQALPGLTSPVPTMESDKMPRNLFQSPQVGQEQTSNQVWGRHPLPHLATPNEKPGRDYSRSNSQSNVSPRPRFLSDSTADATPPGIPPKPRDDKSLIMPVRHTRIPSSGNRATVMDIAQALNNQSPPTSPGRMERAEYTDETLNREASSSLESVEPAVVNYRNMASSAGHAEKRKSSYEKYSAIIMPPLKEEKTPVSTPSGSLLRSTEAPCLPREDVTNIKPRTGHGDALAPTAMNSVGNTDLVHFNHGDSDLIGVDVDALIGSNRSPYTPNNQTLTISVEVMVITSGTATTLARDFNVFYDSEVLAIIHRSKINTTALVSTTVWGWRGKRSKVGEREERKLQDLAKRYGTVLNTLHQYAEPAELVRLLGGQLAVRQGTRARWTPENTAMHLTREFDGVIYVDEHDLDVKNLCSGFSYCLSILDTLYVWYGRGSSMQERRAASAYAQSLATTGTNIVELTEGENDNDEMFWMILGNNEYAKADYWRWRRDADEVDPRIWKVNAENLEEAIVPVLSFSIQTTIQTSVYIIDCVWELFVLVGMKARGKRQDIQLALSVATKLSARVATSRPYAPTIHVVVLPSRLPSDLRLNFRDLDEVGVNAGSVPNHMNIISLGDAIQHLRRDSWEKSALKDHTMLPLGLDPSSVPI